MKKLTTFSLVFLLFMNLIPALNPATKASPSTWYVSPTGSDSNAGDISHPFKTLQKAINASTTSGTIYMRGGTYNATGWYGTRGYRINRSGTTTQPFTIQNYNGETVILDGSKVAHYTYGYGVINIGYGAVAQHNITINGINIRNVDGDYGIIINDCTSGNCDNIKIQKCSFNNLTNYTIRVKDIHTTTNGFYDNFELSNCTFDTVTIWPLNMVEGVGLTGVKNFKVIYNLFKDCGKNFLAMSNNTMYGYVYDNRFFVNSTIRYLDPGSALIALDGGQEPATSNVSHIYIFNNYLWGNNISGISIDAGEDSGGTAENISIYNNVVHTMSWKAGSSSSTNGIQLLRVDAAAKMKNIIIMYNSVYVHNGSGAPFYTENVYTTTIRNITVANNIFVTSRPTETSYVMKLDHLTYPCSFITMTDNLVNHKTKPSKAYWNGATGSLFGSSVVNASPLFVSKYDLHLNATSPAIDAADGTYTITTDYEENVRPQGAGYDIGAYEYYMAFPPAITNILITPNTQQIGRYVNISCNVIDNDGGVKEVRVHITYPDHTTQNLSMKPRYYLNQTYSQKGTYQFFIWADDTSGNSVKSATYQFSITPNGAQVIIDNSMNTAGTGDRFVVTTTITNSDSVAAAYLEYWFDNKTKTNVSMSNTAGDTWEYHSIRIPIRSTDDLYYNISAKNVNNTWSSLTNQQVTVIDDDSPVISNVRATPDSITQGEYVNITCDVNDNIEVDTVKVNISGPVGFTPVHTTLNTGSYYYNTTYTIAGTYEYFIWANDTNRNSDLSMRHTFQIKSLFSSNFLIGVISDENDSNESTINFKAKLVISIEVNPFSFNILSSNEKIVVTKNSKGYIGTKFIIGMFNAAVVSEKNSNDPFNHRILTRFNREPQ